jgi:Xaa-Pro aminopeptidase
LLFAGGLALLSTAGGHAEAQQPASIPSTDTARARWEINCTIRKDKFDFVLPQAMRANDVDVWIVIDRGRGTEPMARDFGISTINGQGFFVFIDRGGDRIERLQLGGETDLAEACGAYDDFPALAQLAAIVKARDPQRIALNFLEDPNIVEGLHVGDGLSYTDYNFLAKELGEPYASRFVSAQRLIADFHGERVASELIEFAKVADLTSSYQERALSNEVITPGMTTLEDVAWWLEERRKEMGAQRSWYPTVYTHFPDGGEVANTDRVIERGDVLQIDWGIERNNFATDIKRFAYVLREGETRVPPGIQNAFDESIKVREIIRHNVRAGLTGRQQIDALKQIIRDAGYVYTEDERASDVEGIEVNVGMHAAGNIGHDLAAGLFEIFPFRTEYMVRQNNIISLEFIVFTPAPEWGGAKVPVNVEENAVITSRGIEWLYPPQMAVQVIR